MQARTQSLPLSEDLQQPGSLKRASIPTATTASTGPAVSALAIYWVPESGKLPKKPMQRQAVDTILGQAFMTSPSGPQPCHLDIIASMSQPATAFGLQGECEPVFKQACRCMLYLLTANGLLNSWQACYHRYITALQPLFKDSSYPPSHKNKRRLLQSTQQPLRQIILSINQS